MKPALSQLWIKICGVTRNRDALLAAELGADAIGLVFYANSPRALVANQISNVVANVSGSVSVIGLFVNPTREEVEVVTARTARAAGGRRHPHSRGCLELELSNSPRP